MSYVDPDGTAHTLDLASGRVVHTVHVGHRLTGVTFTATGELVTVSQNATTVWDTATDRRIGATIHARGAIYALVDPADATDVYTVSAAEVVRWDRHDPAHPKPIGTPFRFQAQTSTATPPVIVFDRTGRRMAAAPTNGNSSTTAVWDTRNHALVRTFTGEPLGFAADGVTLVIGVGNAVELRDVLTGALVGRLPHSNANVTPASASSADDRELAVLNYDDTIDVYDLATRTRIGEPLTVPGYTLPTALLSGNRLVVSNSDETSIWQVGATIPKPGLRLSDRTSDAGHQVSALFLRGGSRILTLRWDDGRATLWDATTARKLGPLAAGRPLQDIRPDGGVAAVSVGDDEVGLWDLRVERQIATIPGTAAGFSPDGTLLAVSVAQGPDRTVELWDVTRPQSPILRRRLTVPGLTDSSAEWFSNDNRSLIVVDYRSLTTTVFDVASGHLRWTRHLDENIGQVGTTPDSRTMFVAVNGFNDNGVRFIDMRNGRDRALLSVPDAVGVAYRAVVAYSQ